ncbi:MAG: hypothetical protein H6733_17755 [Alphaproteobacteria bacterium]|nr:hypothetical protein [Alphaproteobacteria bacterium]
MRRPLSPALVLCLGSTAWAGVPDDVHLDVIARSTLPVHVGGRVQAEGPHRVRFGIDAGWLPDAYLSAWPQADAWRGEVAAVELSTAPAVAFGADVGWRPLARIGWVVDVGWRSVVLRGAEQWTVPAPTFGFGAATAQRRVPVTAWTHLVVVDVGYEHLVDDHLVLRIDAGGAFGVASSSSAEQPAGTDASTADAVADRYRVSVVTPTLSIGVGYRFF